MVTVIQSVYGDYDRLVEWPKQSVPYTHLHVNPPRPHLADRMAAKVAKCQPWRYTDDDIVIWVDGSIVPTDDLFIDHLILNSEGPISQYAHPHRADIINEADASVGMVKYEGQRVREQAQSYVDRGMPRHWGLWATGIIVYRSPVPAWFGYEWLTEQTVWTVQDQISEPFVLWRQGLRPWTIPGDIYHMDHATIRPHRNQS